MPSLLATASGRFDRRIAEEIRLRIAGATLPSGSSLPAERNSGHRPPMPRTFAQPMWQKDRLPQSDDRMS